jgi:hypothetical protein
MAGIVDSQAYFKARLTQLKLIGSLQKFTDHGWLTMAEFAFAANFVPGKGDEKVLVDKVFKKILGAYESDHPQETALRRLFFEAYTLASHDKNI